jgi:hypothetical protein
MSRKHHAHPRPRAARRSTLNWGPIGIIAGGLLVVAAAFLVAQAVGARGTDAAAANAAVYSKGAATAPVTITEWGDFQ